ncbi:DNA-binding protein [Streptomyces sp. NBC_01318]|uniref:DNA-binding protein n=1 Tax=Streptomyces sp. NBC_01318 TaxID=2903823 RepID=UPI002E0E54C5|nr:DNA-binding protein [Streptomyces sp. NBC_01318]
MPAAQPQWILDARRAVGARVRVQRLHLNLTQERLAELTGIESTRPVSRAGSGAAVPPMFSHRFALTVRLCRLLRAGRLIEVVIALVLWLLLPIAWAALP